MFTILVWTFRFLLVYTLLVVGLTTAAVVWALSRRRQDQEPGRPGDME